MYRLSNDPLEFSAQSTRGFLLANANRVLPVDGGVVRATIDAQPTVAVVTGGGSGHYPAFAGLVGPGLAHGAVLGNIFASPAASQVESVGRASDQGRGIVLVYGNYAGDVLNFDEGQDRLRADGFIVKTVAVTDDVSSAPAGEAHRRRGIAGDLVVIKIAGAAAARGHDLDTVAELAARANGRTRTLGVAFSGCTLPGASEPLFTVPPGRMAIGMGIHGEPGIDEIDRLESRPLARLLIDALLPERPAGAGNRAVVLVSGLGSTKYEELFVLFGDVAELLAEHEIEIVEPEVGELVTSFDMAGVSLTLFWLDDELERLWAAPAESPAFRKGSVLQGVRREPIRMGNDRDELPVHVAPPAARAAATEILAVLQRADSRIATIEDELGRLDALAGDGDHGIGMKRGTTAAVAAATRAVARGAGPASTLAAAGVAWGDESGGTSGALWSAALRGAATALSDDSAPDDASLLAAVNAGAEALLSRSKAAVGDKTMIDAIIPFVSTFAAHIDAGSTAALALGADAAMAAALATAELVPAAGRARSHPGRSKGIPDPGAFSFANIVQAIRADKEGKQS